MILVLGNRNDEVAAAIYRQLALHTANVHWVTGEDLVFAPFWRQDVFQNGDAVSQVRLLNGLLIDSRKVVAVHNRLSTLETIHFLNETDRAYATLEFTALFLSFLKSVDHALVCPLQPLQLTAEGLSDLQIKAAAIECGVPVLGSHFTTSPRWRQTRGLIPLAPVRSSGEGFYRKSPHLLWEDKPVRQIVATSTMIRATVAGKGFFCDEVIPFEGALQQLARTLCSIHMDVLIGRTPEGELGLYEVNTAPRSASADTSAAIASFILQKAMQAA